jgi:hypothetical protein
MDSHPFSTQELWSLIAHASQDQEKLAAWMQAHAAAPAALFITSEVDGAYAGSQVFQPAPDGSAKQAQGGRGEGGDPVHGILEQAFMGRYYDEFPVNVSLKIPGQALEDARQSLAQDDGAAARAAFLAAGVEALQADEFARLLASPRISLALALVRHDPGGRDAQLTGFGVLADFEHLWLVQAVGEGESAAVEFRTTTTAEIWSRAENLLFQLGEKRGWGETESRAGL